jgi:hypothetical protein
MCAENPIVSAVFATFEESIQSSGVIIDDDSIYQHEFGSAFNQQWHQVSEGVQVLPNVNEPRLVRISLVHVVDSIVGVDASSVTIAMNARMASLRSVVAAETDIEFAVDRPTVRDRGTGAEVTCLARGVVRR